MSKRAPRHWTKSLGRLVKVLVKRRQFALGRRFRPDGPCLMSLFEMHPKLAVSSRTGVRVIALQDVPCREETVEMLGCVPLLLAIPRGLPPPRRPPQGPPRWIPTQVRDRP